MDKLHVALIAALIIGFLISTVMYAGWMMTTEDIELQSFRAGVCASMCNSVDAENMIYEPVGNCTCTLDGLPHMFNLSNTPLMYAYSE